MKRRFGGHTTLTGELAQIRKARVRGGRGVPPNPQLEILAREMSNVVQADLVGSFDAWVAATDYDKVADAVYSGDWKKVRSKIAIKKLPDFLKDGLSGLRESMTKASRISAKDLNKAAQGADFDPRALLLDSRSPFVDEYLDTRVGMLVENVDENLQVNIQRAIRGGIDGNKTKEQVAQEIRVGLPLNSRQETALANYTDSLSKAGMTQKQIDRATSEYRERLLDQRCQMIARTETSYAQNAAQLEVWKNAQDAGVLGDTLYKVWVVDGDPCLICQDLAGSEVRLDDVFNTADGETLDSPPAHPLCRCYLTVNGSGDN